MAKRRTRKLDRKRRRFYIRLSDNQTLWFEHLAKEVSKTENSGVNPNYGDMLDGAIELLPEYQAWLEKEKVQDEG